MPTLYRLTRSARAHEAFNGEGSRRYGGRWNSPGLRAVYTSGSRALALLETLVHLDTSEQLPSFAFITVEIDSEDIEAVAPEAADTLNRVDRTRPIGDRWLRTGARLALAVPSVIVPQEFNYILNPAHPRFVALRTSAPKDFVFDNRLYVGGLSAPSETTRNKPRS